MKRRDLPCIGLQSINGFPDIPDGHEHIGIWLITSHIAPWPQAPGQGSVHLFLIHALFRGQSEFIIHSGLHPVYGSPWYSGRHVHIPSLHCAFGPHGEGLHGSVCNGSTAEIKINYNYL